MTDVSNLDDLAKAISTSSSKIRSYAVAQAAATQSQEVEIQSLKARIAALEAEPVPPPPPPPPTGHLTGTHWPNNNEFQTLKNAGYGFAVTTVPTGDVAAATAKLDAAKAAGIKLIVGPYPEPYTLANGAWTISSTGMTTLNYLKSRESEIIALFTFNEPYWVMGLGSAELRSLRTKIKTVWPTAKVYHDLGEPGGWVPGGPYSGGQTKWADQSGVCDYAGYWYYPFRSSGYLKTQGIDTVRRESAFIRDSMGAVPVFLGQSHSAPSDSLVYPSDANLSDWNDSIRTELPANALISWYVFRQALYPDFLANHPNQWPLTIA